MDFDELMEIADQNREESVKTAQIKRYSTEFKPSKVVKQQIDRSAIASFLARKENEKKKEVREAAKRKKELLALRASNPKSNKAAKLMKSRTKDNDFSIIKLTEAEEEMKKKVNDEMHRKQTLDKLNRMKLRIALEVEERQSMAGKKRRRKADCSSSGHDKSSSDFELDTRLRFNESHASEGKIKTSHVCDKTLAKPVLSVRKPHKSLPPPSMDYHSLLNFASKIHTKPVDIITEADVEERPMSKREKEELEAMNRIKNKRSMLVKPKRNGESEQKSSRSAANSVHTVPRPSKKPHYAESGAEYVPTKIKKLSHKVEDDSSVCYDKVSRPTKGAHEESSIKYIPTKIKKLNKPSQSEDVCPNSTTKHSTSNKKTLQSKSVFQYIPTKIKNSSKRQVEEYVPSKIQKGAEVVHYVPTKINRTSRDQAEEYMPTPFNQKHANRPNKDVKGVTRKSSSSHCESSKNDKMFSTCKSEISRKVKAVSSANDSPQYRTSNLSKHKMSHEKPTFQSASNAISSNKGRKPSKQIMENHGKALNGNIPPRSASFKDKMPSHGKSNEERRHTPQRPPLPGDRFRQVQKRPCIVKKQKIESEDEDSDMSDFIDDDPVEEECDFSSHIREIFKYDKTKYRYEDDDDIREASFAEQMKEECRSTKIGIMEDLEDIRREKEEEMRKRIRMKKKLARRG